MRLAPRGISVEETAGEKRRGGWRGEELDLKDPSARRSNHLGFGWERERKRKREDQ